MIVFVDTSVLAKWYVLEAGSIEVDEFLSGATELGVVSITLAECVAAIGKKVRRGEIELNDGERAVGQLLDAWPRYRKVQVTEALVHAAQRLAWEHRLRGYDSIQLAAALEFQRIAGIPICVATNDDELRAACTTSGLFVWPEDVEALRRDPGPPLPAD